MRAVSFIRFGKAFRGCLGVLLLYSPVVLAQVAFPPPQDPLMALMVSQPKIDVTSPVVATALFDPPMIRLGEKAIYRVSFNALEESVEFPTEIPAPKELQLRVGAHGQMLQMGGAALVPFSSFNQRVRATSLGTFTIPQFTVQVYGKPVVVPAAQLQVMAELPAGLATPPQLLLYLPATNVFVGQPIHARVLLPGSPGGMVQGLGGATIQLNGDGFLVDQAAARQRIEMMSRSGTNVATYIYETLITPIQAGKLNLFAQGFTGGGRFAGPIVISGSGFINGAAQQFTLLETEPELVTARPLPHEGELPGFTGAVGKFAIEPPVLSTNLLRVGDPVKLAVTVRGEANFSRLVAPPPPRVRDWQVFMSPANTTPAQVVQAQGFVTFVYNLVPLTTETRATPAIPFSCFDPAQGIYLDLTIPPVPVTVAPGQAPADLAALMQTGPATDEPEQELTLSGLAAAPGRMAQSLAPVQQRVWFPLTQLVPAAAFLGLWGWDRRRRFLEQHPDIVLRRRARKELHREWRRLRRAAGSGDALGFATGAVAAMRVGSAPHYPAEPRALVGSDVLGLLPETERSHRAGDVIRRFFAINDATRFAATAGDATELLSLQPELDLVLRRLEERL